ncbi:MAG TPA: hypothetical protein PLU24_00520 [Candidatus Omnitrophota bacterium]|nr:hypothetical protein [Candidatus Omnitrophota bacterium]
MKRYLFILVFILLPNLSLFADDIGLRSGKVVSGKIIEFGKDYLKFENDDGVITTFSADQIASINGRRPGDVDVKNLKCEVLSKEGGYKDYEEGEELVYCPDSIRYIHRLFNFYAVFPIYWDKIYISDRKLEDSGKITSIAFSPIQDQERGGAVFIHVMLQSGVKKTLEALVAGDLENLKNDKENFGNLISKPERVSRAGSQEMKFTYWHKRAVHIEKHFIKNDDLLYVITFHSDTQDHYKKYKTDFENILRAWGIVTKEVSVNELENNRMKFHFLD